MNDTTLLIGLGVAAVLVAWLIFSVLKKVIGLLFLAALAFGAFMVWRDPALLNQLLTTLRGMAQLG